MATSNDAIESNRSSDMTKIHASLYKWVTKVEGTFQRLGLMYCTADITVYVSAHAQIGSKYV